MRLPVPPPRHVQRAGHLMTIMALRGDEALRFKPADRQKLLPLRDDLPTRGWPVVGYM